MEALRNILIVCGVLVVTSRGQLLPPVEVVDVATCLNFNNYFRFGHETDCIYFYECHAGLTYLLKCPDRSWFDSNTQNCTEDESVCRSTEEREDDSRSMDADDISDSIDPNKQVSIVYKYIYITERPKRINREYKRNRINPVTVTDVDIDVETETTRIYNDNEIKIKGYEYDTSTPFSTTSDYSSEDDTEPAPTLRRKFINQTPQEKTGHRKNLRYGHKKNKKLYSSRRVYRNVEDLLENVDYDDDPDEIKRNYRNQLKRFVKRLKSGVHSGTTKKRNAVVENKKKHKTTTEPTDYETDWPDEVTRAPIKKITSTRKRRKRTKTPPIRYVNFGSYAAPFNPYKIKGRFFQPSFINKGGSNLRLVKRSLFRKSRSSESTSSRHKNSIKQTHKLEKRNGVHIKLNLREKSKSLNALQYSTNRPLFDTYLTTSSPPDSFDILKLFKPSIEDNSLTSLENPRVKVNEIDLLKLYESNKLSRKSYNKEKFMDKSDENTELDKSSNNDKTEPSNFLQDEDDSSRQYIIIHYRRRRLPAHLRPSTDFYSTDSDATPLTTNPTIQTSTVSSTSFADKYINSFHYGTNFDFEKEFSKVRQLIERDYPNYSGKKIND